ncbi:Hypp953 [Branchiostoma lanceolatum]|uniref:Hypp953 protein n=1 Tax=Branchiostoma lanceolatum TaxID=7740 RepID=A0A8K0EGS4_BRALA|nr:Hypp953 [Branchiostoma lanceolatum]
MVTLRFTPPPVERRAPRASRHRTGRAGFLGGSRASRRAGLYRGAVLPAYITGLSVPIFCSQALKHQLSKPQRPSPRDRLPSATPAHGFLWTPRSFVMLTGDL